MNESKVKRIVLVRPHARQRGWLIEVQREDGTFDTPLLFDRRDDAALKAEQMQREHRVAVLSF